MATVLVVGASGFIGRHIARALEEAHHSVIYGVRDSEKRPGRRTIAVDFARDSDPADWSPRLAGVDVVINAVGILRESADASFEALHVAAPRALFAACVSAGVRKVIQISALGADDEAVSRYHLSKKRADDYLTGLPLSWAIVQPSLVYGEGGASAAIFTTMAALPLVPVPAHGTQRVQPVHIDDVVQLVVRLLENSSYDGARIAAVGPRALTFRDFLGALREGMRLGRATFVPVPMFLTRIAARVADHLPRAFFDSEALGMLERGNVASAAAITKILGHAPRPVESFIPADRAKATADGARLNGLLPTLRYAMALVWIVTGIVSLGVYPVSESYALLARAGLTGTVAVAALYGAAAIDLAIGAGILILRRRRWLWRAQALLIVGYTAIISIALPEFWLHPYGPVLKNVPMLAAILLLHEFEER
jgi:uncharacterized protein YbjT (DUF2867 family)